MRVSIISISILTAMLWYVTENDIHVSNEGLRSVITFVIAMFMIKLLWHVEQYKRRNKKGVNYKRKWSVN